MGVRHTPLQQTVIVQRRVLFLSHSSYFPTCSLPICKKSLSKPKSQPAGVMLVVTVKNCRSIW